MQAKQFSWELRFHANRQKFDLVLDGICHGFKLGFCHTQRHKPAKKNKPSADQHASVIDEYLAHEVSQGSVAGPFDFPPLPNLQVSSFGVIPKWEQVGKWHLIVDLSSPTGSSVNDKIDPEKFTLHYIMVDQVIQLVSQFGPGALMAKFDVEAAYRNVPVHPLDRYLLGMKWRNRYYIGLTLPFGLLSASFSFHAIADMVAWILMHWSIIWMTFLQLVPQTPRNVHNLCTTLTVCKQLGLPLHPGKCEGPATVFVVLGIELDLVNQVACLQAEKLLALQGLILACGSQVSGAVNVNWSPSLAIYIMLPKWSGLAEPSYIA